MSTYIALFKWTDQGIMNVKDSPARAQAGLKAVEAVGAKVIGFWYTDGIYDMVAVAEWENDEALATFLAEQAAQGFVRITTLKARTPEEFAQIVEMVP
jgi:uncharacterized protein with GYD domain